MKILQGRQALYKKALNYKATLKCPLFHIKANLVFQADAYTVKKVWLSLLFLKKKPIYVVFSVSMSLKSVTNISFLSVFQSSCSSFLPSDICVL